MSALKAALSKLIVGVQKAKDQIHDSRLSSPRGRRKPKQREHKAIRGGLERDVWKKIAEVETPPTEGEESSRTSESGRKDLEEFEATDEPAELRERYGRLPLVQSREEQQDAWTPLPNLSPEMVNQNV